MNDLTLFHHRTAAKTAPVFTILYADDNPGDIDLAREVIGETMPACLLYGVTSGEEILDFLYRRKKYAAGVTRPHLILLDWNMPKINGIDLLRTIKSDAELHAIPVVMFTDSPHDADITSAYAARANCYVVKPTDADLFHSHIRVIVTYWSSVAIWDNL